MLGCTCRLHLGIQWWRIRCSRYYAQHQLGRVQGLCPTLPVYIFMCFRASCSTQRFSYSCVLEILAQHKHKHSCSPKLLSQHKYKYSCPLDIISQHKTSINHVLQSSSLNTKHLINHVLQVPCPTHKIIHKTYVTILHPIYQTNHHAHMQWGPRPHI